MVLVDLDAPLTLKETEFPDLLQVETEPSSSKEHQKAKKKTKKENSRRKSKVIPPQEIQILQDQESISLVEEVCSEDEEDLLLDELLEDGTSVGDKNVVSQESPQGDLLDELLDDVSLNETEADEPLQVVQHNSPEPHLPQKERANNDSVNTDTLTTDSSDRNDGFSSSGDTYSDHDQQVVVHNLESLTDNNDDVKYQPEPPVVVLHHLDDDAEVLGHPVVHKDDSHSDHTPSTQSQEGFSSDDGNEVIVLHQTQEEQREQDSFHDDFDDEDVDEVPDDDDDDNSSSSQETASLLGHAKDRIAMQHLYDEIAQLEDIIDQKNVELENLSGQLRRAVATKCDLVIAHTELERHHEFHLACQETHVDQLKREKCTIQDHQSEVERELLNELVQTVDELQKARKSHRQELEDWERMHRNEMLEKDFEIAQLTEQVRQLQEQHQQRPSPVVQSGMKVMFRK